MGDVVIRIEQSLLGDLELARAVCCGVTSCALENLSIPGQRLFEAPAPISA